MHSHRISVKYFVKEPDAVVASNFIPIFHRWIQQQTVENHLLVDVADYKHVHHGPGVLLIAHEADFSIDFAGGWPGLLYTRKRGMEGDLPRQLRTVFREALKGCRRIEEEPALNGALRFRTDEAQLTFLDRLRMPNTPETFDAVRADVEAVLAELHPDVEVKLEPIYTDPRQPFSLRIQAEGAAALSTQLERLERVHA